MGSGQGRRRWREEQQLGLWLICIFGMLTIYKVHTQIDKYDTIYGVGCAVHGARYTVYDIHIRI